MTSFLKPIGAWVDILWKDRAQDLNQETVYFSFGKVDNSTYPAVPCDTYGVADDDIFHYCNLEDMEEDNFDFMILGYQPVYNYEGTPASLALMQAQDSNITKH
jgi:hypothetical protein